MTQHEEYTARMLRRFGLFRPSRAAVCPRVVAGKRCHAWRLDRANRDCLCVRYGGTRLLDHAYIWRTKAGQYVLTAEPYGVDEPRLLDLRQELATLGLTIDVTNESYWFHGTQLLIIRRAEPCTSLRLN
jgi:hypothetical protein